MPDPLPHDGSNRRVESLQESLQESHWRSSHDDYYSRRSPSQRLEPAPRIVPGRVVTRQAPAPFLFRAVLAPFRLLWRGLTTALHFVLYVLHFLPGPVGVRFLALQQRLGLNAAGSAAAVTGGAANGSAPGGGAGGSRILGLLKPSSSGRRNLLPREAALRFKREFEEQYGTARTLPWFENGFAQALDVAKRDLRFLLIVLVAPEHDDGEAHARQVLLAPEVVAFVTDPSNCILLWGGNVADSEAWQVALAYGCTKFPFAALVCLTPRSSDVGVSSSDGGAPTRMSIVKRFAGPTTAQTFLAELTTALNKYMPDLAAVAADRAASNAARNIRREQDDAYERSLAIDRERARKRREEEAARREEERRAEEERRKAEELEAKKAEWRRWRAAKLGPEPAAGTGAAAKSIVRVALKMGESGERVVRRFHGEATIDDVYAFVECFEEAAELDESKVASLLQAGPPDGYSHEYTFRVVCPLPRVVYDPRNEKSLVELVGRATNLIVEPFVDDEDGGNDDADNGRNGGHDAEEATVSEKH